MKIKQLLGALLCAAALLSLFACQRNGANGDSSAPETTAPPPSPVEDFEYVVTEENTIKITKYIGTADTVVIPSDIDGLTVTEIGAVAFENAAVTEVLLPKSLTQIGTSAFAGCTALKHITIPSDCLTLYSHAAFYGSGLESVTFAEGVSYIPETCFAGTQLTEVILPSTVKTIAWQAFSGCENLKKVKLNDGLETIEQCAFSVNPQLTEIVIPASVTSLSEYAFVKTDNLTAVKFEGNAPAEFLCEDERIDAVFSYYEPTFVIYYHEGAEGFSSPEWNGFATDLW